MECTEFYSVLHWRISGQDSDGEVLADVFNPTALPDRTEPEKRHSGKVAYSLSACPRVSLTRSLARKAVLHVLFGEMKLRNTFWVAISLLALLGTPSLSCFVPRQLLNANDSDCCRQMGDQCGSTTMPSSRSCCESPLQVSQPYIGSISHTGPASAGVVLAILPISPAVLPLAVNGSPTIAEFHSPPLSPPKTNSILRI
jgi:hypothetical protein